MSIMDRARRLEAQTRERLLRQARLLEQKIQQRLQGDYVGDEPLEIWRAIARDIESQVLAVKGGHMFPYHQIHVTICATLPERQAALSAAFEPPRINEDVRTLLQDSGCQVADDLAVTLRFSENPGEDWKNPVVHVKYVRTAKRGSRQPEPQPIPPPERRTARLRILEGKTVREFYELTGDVTFVGRGASASGRSINHANHVVFEDNDDPVNRTVSRKHARIVYNAASGDWTLYDESSARGTTLIRAGRTSRIAPGAHGRKLQPGDQIIIGKAVLQFE
jgi:hypothetical protein